MTKSNLIICFGFFYIHIIFIEICTFVNSYSNLIIRSMKGIRESPSISEVSEKNVLKKSIHADFLFLKLIGHDGK